MGLATEFIKAFNLALDGSDINLGNPFFDLYNAKLDKNSEDYEKAYFKLLAKEGVIDDPDPNQFKKSFPLFIEKLLKKAPHVAECFFNLEKEDLENICSRQNHAYLLAVSSGMTDLAKALDNPSITNEEREQAFSLAVNMGKTDFALELLLSFKDVKAYAKAHPDIFLKFAEGAARIGNLDAVKFFFEVTAEDNIKGVENILSEAVKHNKLPIVELFLQNKGGKEKSSDTSILLNIIKNKPPEMTVASLLSIDSFKKMMSSNAVAREQAFSLAVNTEKTDFALALLSFDNVKAYARRRSQSLFLKFSEDAVRMGNLEAVKLFLEVTAKDNIEDIDNVLSEAVYHNKLPIVEFFLQNKSGETSSDISMLLNIIKNIPPEMTVANLLSIDSFKKMIDSNEEGRRQAFSLAVNRGRTDFALALFSFDNVKAYAKENPDIFLKFSEGAARMGNFDIVKLFFEVTAKDNIEGVENILSEAVKHNNLPIVELFLQNKGGKDKSSDISILLNIIENKPPEMTVANLLSIDSFKKMMDSNAVEVFKCSLGLKYTKALEIILQIPQIREQFVVTQNMDVLFGVRNPDFIAAYLNALGLGSDDKNNASIDEISENIVLLLDNSDDFRSREDKVAFLNEKGINELALQEKIISMIEYACKLKDPVPLQKYFSFNLFYRALENAKDENSIVKTLKQYPGVATQLYPSAREIEDVVNFFLDALNKPAVLSDVFKNPSGYINYWNNTLRYDPAITNKFIALAIKKFVCASSYSEQWIELINKYPGSISDLIQNDNYKTNADLAKFLDTLLKDEKLITKAYSNPEEILTLFQNEGIRDKEIQKAFLRIVQEKKLNDLITKATSYSAIEAAQELYQKGVRVSHETVKMFLENARKENNQNKVDFLLKLFELRQGSLFANVDELKLAAIHANERFLVQPYQNGLTAGRWGNQRAIALLSDNSVLDVPPQYLYGISIAIELASEPTRKQGALVTLDEIVETAAKRGISLNKEKIGQVDVTALEAGLGKKVMKVKYRPNHDLQHSLRTAAFIYPIYQLFNANEERKDRNTRLSRNEIEALQMMMVFSVLGREDETGFGDSKSGGGYLYQSYRAVDGFEFLSYCLEHWDRHYKNVFSDKAALYQAALVVELMGFPTLPEDIENINPKPLLSILMKGYSPENMALLKKCIKEFPNNNILRSYSDKQLQDLFPKESIKYQNEKSDIFLAYMNSAHGSDLLRCYEKGDPRKQEEKGTCYGNLIHFYRFHYRALSAQGKLGEISPADQVVDYFKFIRGMLNEFGEQKTTDFELNDRALKEVLEVAKALEKILHNYRGKNFAEIKDLKFEKKVKVNGVEVETLAAFLMQLDLEDKIKETSDLTASSEISDKSVISIISRFLAQSLLKEGYPGYTPAAFDHCHYNLTSRGQKQDIQSSAANPQNHNFEKEVESTLSTIEEMPRPVFCRKTNFTTDEVFKAQMQKIIHKACQDGVAIFKAQEEITIEFSSVEAATEVFDALLKLGKIKKIPSLEKNTTAPYLARAKITEFEYALIKPYLKFRKATPPKQHNVESHIVEPTGKIAVLSLIGQYNAVICNHNAVMPAGGDKTGVDWYVNQLEHPSTERPIRLTTLTETQRAKVHHVTPTPSGERYAINRGLVAPLPVEQQEPRNQPLAQSEYWREDNSPAVRDVYRVRGQPKNTVFAKKSPHTLMVPSGQTLFQGIDPFNYFPIGIISDVNAMHTIGERYIWKSNVVTNQKFWIDGTIDDRDLETRARAGMTLSDLRNHLQSPNVIAEQWNELLLGGSKSAIKALACSGDLSFGNKTTLSYRLNLVTQAIFLREKYGINAPLLIVEGDKAPYLYTEKMLLVDIMRAVKGLKTDTYPYMSQASSTNGWYRLTCEEQRVLIQFLEVLTGNKFEGTFTMYGSEKEYLKNNPAEPYAEYVKKIDDENKKSLEAYLAKYNLESKPDFIKEKVDNLKLVGSESREREYLKQLLSTSPSSEKTNCDLLIRNVALGHVELVKELIERPEVAALLTKGILPNGGGLLEVAVNNGQPEMVKFLLSKNCNPHTTNNDGVSPIDIAGKMMLDTKSNNHEYYPQIHSELINFKPAASPTAHLGLHFSEAHSSAGAQKNPLMQEKISPDEEIKQRNVTLNK